MDTPAPIQPAAQPPKPPVSVLPQIPTPAASPEKEMIITKPQSKFTPSVIAILVLGVAFFILGMLLLKA